MLQRLGFHSKWVNLIMQCVSTVSYSYLINNSVHGLVNPKRGIRRGDPLSPYLFILYGQVLFGLCQKAERDGTFQGIKVARGSPRVNHLLFADDTSPGKRVGSVPPDPPRCGYESNFFLKKITRLTR